MLKIIGCSIIVSIPISFNNRIFEERETNDIKLTQNLDCCVFNLARIIEGPG